MMIHSKISYHVLALATLGLLACGGVEDPGEGGPDAGAQVDPPDAADPASPDAAPGECSYGHTGPDCAECIADYQDVDNDGVCKPSCEATGSNGLNCGGFGDCQVDEATGDRFCECMENYEGFTCEMCSEGYVQNANGACLPYEPPTTGMVLWLDADDDASITTGSGGIIGWQDRRGGSHPSLTQATSTARPDRVAAGMNDRDVVRFDGASTLTLNSFDGLAGADYTIFVVFGPPDQSANATIFRTSNLEHGTTFLLERVSAGLAYRASHYAPFGSAGADAVTSSLSSSLDKLFVITRNTSGLLKYMRLTANKGGALDGDAILNGELTQTEIGVGHRLYLGDGSLIGDIAELIIYDRAVVEDELAQIQSYLAGKWNLQ